MNDRRSSGGLRGRRPDARGGRFPESEASTGGAFLAVALLAAGAAAGCGDDTGGTACTRHEDCPAGSFCVEGRCLAADGGPETDADADVDPEADAADGDADTLADGDGETYTGVRCDDRHPCPAGWICEEGVCAVDCGGAMRCGDDVCCPAGQVCYLGACTTPGDECSAPGPGECGVGGRCPAGEQCDPSIGRCMPVPADAACEFRPEGTFDPTLLWEWDGATAHPTFRHAIVTPAVADINDDGAADVVVPVTESIPGTPTVAGILCALSGLGDCAGGPRELWCTDPAAARVNWVGQPAVADLEGTGELTIVVGDGRAGAGCSRPELACGITAYDTAGNRLPDFGTDSTGAPVDVTVWVGGPGIADLDGDGRAEVYVGFTVFDSDGRLRWSHPASYAYGPLTVAADLDGDGSQELVGGNMAFHADGTEAWAAGVAARSLGDGWPAVADFDLDGSPEVVVVSEGAVRVFDAAGNLFSTAGAAVAGLGGPPTVADLDGDGIPDLAVAGQNSLTAFRVGPAPDHALTVLWQVPSRDFSSNFTGSSVFDFDGDGRAEVIYGDECYARVYDGVGDGAGGTTVRFEVPNTSCTGTEYPVVADLTGDGKAEFVVVANNAEAMGTGCSPYVAQCRTAFPGYEPQSGVRVYRDRNDNWVATRAIWNQHTYHVTNVCDGRDEVCPAAENRYGAVPRTERPSWAFPAGAPLNSFRVNAQLEGAFSAPNLVPRNARADLSLCPGAIGLRVDVTNLGALGVPLGVPVAFYHLGTAGARTLLGVGHTRRVLLPGGSEPVRLEWSPFPAELVDVTLEVEIVVDDDGTGHGVANECDETDNATTIAPLCAGLG